MLSTNILTFLQRDDVGSDNISAGDAAEQDVKRTISTNHASSGHDALQYTTLGVYSNHARTAILKTGDFN